MNQTLREKSIRVRINIGEDDPLFEFFNKIKEEIGLNANTEVVRYSIKKVYDIVVESEK